MYAVFFGCHLCFLITTASSAWHTKVSTFCPMQYPIYVYLIFCIILSSIRLNNNGLKKSPCLISVVVFIRTVSLFLMLGRVFVLRSL